MAIRFEWDEVKSRLNLLKHGISFEQAIQVFEDPWQQLEFDRVVEGEERWHTIGAIADLRIVIVVHTMRDADDSEVIRVISARRADGWEERLYGEQFD